MSQNRMKILAATFLACQLLCSLVLALPVPGDFIDNEDDYQRLLDRLYEESNESSSSNLHRSVTQSPAIHAPQDLGGANALPRREEHNSIVQDPGNYVAEDVDLEAILRMIGSSTTTELSGDHTTPIPPVSSISTLESFTATPSTGARLELSSTTKSELAEDVTAEPARVEATTTTAITTYPTADSTIETTPGFAAEAVEKVAVKESEDCPICLEEIDEKDLEKTICGHDFHRGCLKSWQVQGESGRKCPICRKDLVTGIDQFYGGRMEQTGEWRMMLDSSTMTYRRTWVSDS